MKQEVDKYIYNFIKGLAIVFILISITLTVYIIYNQPEEISLCSKIQGTPAWADKDGNILSQGYTDFGLNKSTGVVDKLILDEITFIYKTGCGWCDMEIEFFGEDWNKYKDSGLTIDCAEEQ